MTGNRVVLGLACALGACTSGDTGTMTNGVLCSAQFGVTGTFVPNAATPNPDMRECWPIGTWTFTVVSPATANTCSPAPTPLPQYVFTGTALYDNTTTPPQLMGEQFVYTTDPSTMFQVKVTDGGVGACEGDLSLYSADGTQVWSMKPELNLDYATVGGSAEFRIYGTNQWTTM